VGINSVKKTLDWTVTRCFGVLAQTHGSDHQFGGYIGSGPDHGTTPPLMTKVLIDTQHPAGNGQAPALQG
jgi:hypothetical protein